MSRGRTLQSPQGTEAGGVHPAQKAAPRPGLTLEGDRSFKIMVLAKPWQVGK